MTKMFALKIIMTFDLKSIVFAL